MPRAGSPHWSACSNRKRRQRSPRRETIDRIRDVIQQHPQGMIAGEPVMVIDGFRYLERDGGRSGLGHAHSAGTGDHHLFRQSALGFDPHLWWSN